MYPIIVESLSEIPINGISVINNIAFLWACENDQEKVYKRQFGIDVGHTSMRHHFHYILHSFGLNDLIFSMELCYEELYCVIECGPARQSIPVEDTLNF